MRGTKSFIYLVIVGVLLGGLTLYSNCGMMGDQSVGSFFNDGIQISSPSADHVYTLDPPVEIKFEIISQESLTGDDVKLIVSGDAKSEMEVTSVSPQKLQVSLHDISGQDGNLQIQVSKKTTSESVPVTLGPGYDVVLVIGQSNTHSGQGSNPDFDGPNPEIFQLGRFGAKDYKVIPAEEPLHHWTGMDNFIGFALTFAKKYVQQQIPDRKVLIVPSGASNTGFLANQWNPGDPYFVDALERTNFVLNTYERSRLVAILWHQGEADLGHGGYGDDLDAMINTLRSDLVGNQQKTPFLLGGLADTFIDYYPAYAPQIQAFIEDTPNRIPDTYFVSGEGLAPNAGDFVHFSSVSQRTLGKRYFDVFKSIQ